MNTTKRRPYSIRNGMLCGPLSMPAACDDINDPDGFVDFCNDIYEKGFDAGLARGAERGEEGLIAMRLSAMVERWGPRCRQYSRGCACCNAWYHFDETGEVLHG